MNTTIVAAAAGVTIALRVAEGALPEVLHWGPALGPVDAEQAAALAAATGLPWLPDGPDIPARYGILPEGRYGTAVRPGLIGSRAGRDWTPDWSVTAVTFDGRPVAEFEEVGAGVLAFVAEAPLAGLGLVITIELTPQGLVAVKCEVTNTGEGEFTVDELTVAMPVPARANELLDFAGRWGVERYPHRSPLTTGAHRREGRHGRTGHDSAYVLHLGVPGFGFGAGEVWSAHTAWSGNHIHSAERDLFGGQLLSGGELLLAGEGRLGTGESYVSPWVYFNYGDGLDASADRFHAYLRAMPHAPGVERPVTLNVWEAVYFDHDVDRLVDLAQRAAKLGVERFVLDDGWFGGRRDAKAGLGDWFVSPDVWPTGLHPLVDAVTGLGMEFGLWFEPEMINEDSDVAREHPDWIMQPAGRLPVTGRWQQVMNLANPDAFAHVLGQVDAVLSEYDIAYVKWDHNRDLVDSGATPDGRAAVHEQTLAYYRLLDELRLRHPEVEFESCSSGGGRIDLEVLKRAERVWVSDIIDPAERQRMLPWTGQLIPAEWQGSHVASGRSHTTGRWHDLNFRAATAVFGHLGIEWDLAQATDEELAELSWWIDWYKTNRAVLLGGRQVRVDMPDPATWLKGVVTDEKAIFSLSQLSVGPGGSLGLIRFPGLDDEATYRLTAIDRQQVPAHMRPAWEAGPVVLPGRLLSRVGIRAPMMQPETAVIFEIERI